MRRPSGGWSVIAAIVLLWLTVDRPWTVRPIGAPATSGPFDAVQYVDAIWTSRVVPAIEANAVPLARAREIASAPGASRGVAVAFDGIVVSLDTSSRVGVALVDADPIDGRPDAAVQIGPVLRGTALRDALAFVRFSDFTNQMQFAAVANALNARVLSDVIGATNVTDLPTRRVRVVGVTSVAATADALPSVVPVHLVVRETP